MAQNSAESADVLDIDALMNSQDEKDVSAVLTSPSTMKQEPNALDGGNAAPTPPVTQNGGPEASLDVIDLTRPVKTLGEASPSTSTALAASVANDIAHNLKPTAASDANSSENLANSIQMVGMGGAFGGSHITTLGSDLRLTHEEQAAAYKKANILALTSLAKRGGPSAREMLSIQAKLQEFLTSLISLAGKNGPHVKLTVQLLVSKLVTGAITEEEFAANIEKDLHSQHQPSLLPFLKSSVPHLKTRLQLQQGIMKELLQRMATEKMQRQTQQPLAGGQQPPVAGQQLGVGGQQSSMAGQQQLGVGGQQSSMAGQQQLGVGGQQSSMAGQQQLGVGGQQAPVAGQQLGVGGQQLSMAGQQLGVGGQQSSMAVQQLKQAQQVLLNQQAQVQQQLAEKVQALPTQPQGQPPVPVQPQSLQTQPQAQDQQQQQQELLQRRRLSDPVNPALSRALQQQNSQPLQPHKVPISIAATPPSSSVPAPAPVPQSMQKLTPEQQKFVAMHHQRRQQFLKAQQLQQSGSPGSQQSSSSAPQTSQSANPLAGAATNIQLARERQQQLVNEQVSLMMGGTKAAAIQLGAKQIVALGSSNLGQFGIPVTRGMTATTVGSVTGRTSFADLKLSARSQSPAGGQQPAQAKGKGKAASGKKKDLAEQDDDDEDESMDIAGVNLQEETAHFLPQSLGESVSRTCKDEVFLNLPSLRQKVAAKARLYGIRDVSEEFLILLSHATQERLRDTVEKLTVISQHRVEALKEDPHYEVTSEVRGQLKVLESIDRINHKRKQEREKEKIIRAARSRSKPEDPELAAKIKEQAKQLQLEEEQMIRNKAANATALAAIKKRKRPAVDGMITGSLSSASAEAGGSGGPTSMTSLLGAPGVTRQHKRRITTRDVVLYMEQERETRKSKLLYKSFLK